MELFKCYDYDADIILDGSR